jgi:putative ABC transport system permease protein
VFTVVDHILFRPLDLPDSEQLVAVCQTHPQGDQWCGASPTNAHDWEARSRTLSAVGVGRAENAALRTEGGARNVSIGIATAGFLQALGVTPVMGRLIAPEDVPPLGPANVAVLTFEFWQAEFGGDTEVLGQTVTLEERTYEIIGVLPQETRVPRLDYARAWLPLPFDPADEENRDWRGFRAWARLTPGVTLEEAQLELASIQRALVEEHPEVLAGSGVEVRRMRDYLVENARTRLLVFAAAVFVALLIVSVNVASLLLAHATSREREFVVRTALGATRSSLARQLLVESGVLAGMGGLGGIVVGFWATDAFLHLAPSGIPRIGEVHVDARILAFAVLATGIAGIVFGLAPLARLWRMNVATRLRESHRLTGSWGTQRTRRTLVVAQLTLAMMLLVGAGLLLRSFTGLLAWQPGFETSHVLTFQLFPGFARYSDRDQVLTLYRRAENELAVIPGVRTVGTASAGPLFGGGDGTTPFQIEGQATLSLDEAPTVAWYDVSPNYFSTLGVPLQSGRHLSESDLRGTAPVAIVNAAFARRFWPSGSPVGERITLPNLNHSVEIVGVVGNIQPFNPGDDAEPEIYFSNRQWTRWATYFVLRTDIDPTTIASPVGTTLAAIDPELVPSRVMTLPQLAAQERVGPRFNLALVGLFAIVALLLAAVGTYGVLAYTVALRRHEIGIRMALGADGSRIVRWIGTEGIKIIGLGTVLGVIGAMALARFLEGMLLGVATTDILAYAGPAVLLIAAGGVACLIPAMRATRIQPTEAIRED